MPSTTLYSDVKIIIAMVGSVNLMSAPMVKWRFMSCITHSPSVRSETKWLYFLPSSHRVRTKLRSISIS